MRGLPRIQHFQDGGSDSGPSGDSSYSDSGWSDSTGFSDFGTSWGDTTTSGNWSDSASWSDPGTSWSDAGNVQSQDTGTSFFNDSAFNDAGNFQSPDTGTSFFNDSAFNNASNFYSPGDSGTSFFNDSAFSNPGSFYDSGNNYSYDTYSGSPYADTGTSYTSPSGMDLAGDFGPNAANMGNSLAGVTGGMPTNQYGPDDASGRTYDPTSPALTDPQSLSNVSAAFPANPNNPFVQAYDFLSNINLPSLNPLNYSNNWSLNPDAFRGMEEGQQGREGRNALGPGMTSFQGAPTGAQQVDETGFNPNAPANPYQDTPFTTANPAYTQDTPFTTANPNYDQMNTPFMEAINPQQVIPNVEVLSPSQVPASVMSANPAANLNQQQIAQEQQQSPALNLDPVNVEASRTAQETPQAPSNAQEVQAEATTAAAQAASRAAEVTGAPQQSANAAAQAAADAVSRGADHPTTQQVATEAAYQAGANQPQSQVVGTAAAEAAMQARDAVQATAPPSSVPATGLPSVPSTAAPPTTAPATASSAPPAALPTLTTPAAAPTTAPSAQATLTAGFPSLAGSLFSARSAPAAPPSVPSTVGDTLSNLLDMLNPISRAEARGRGPGRGRDQQVAGRIRAMPGAGAPNYPGSTQYPGSENTFANTSATKGAQPYQGIIIHSNSGFNGMQGLANWMMGKGTESNQKSLGYQYAIDRNGQIYQFGNPASSRSNHISGTSGRSSQFHLTNRNSLGIALEGVDSKNPPTAEQLQALRGLVPWAQQTFNIPQGQVFGHGEVQGKDEYRAHLGPGNTPEGRDIAQEFRGPSSQTGRVAESKWGTGVAAMPGKTGVPLTAISQALVSSRANVMAELKSSPGLAAQFGRMAYAEVGAQGPEAIQAFMETAINRATADGRSLQSVLADRGYFPGKTFTAAARAKLDSDTVAMLNAMLNAIGRGSNVANFATGNASRDKSGREVVFGSGPQTAAYGPPGRAERFGIESAAGHMAWAQSVGYRGPATLAEQGGKGAILAFSNNGARGYYGSTPSNAPYALAGDSGLTTGAPTAVAVGPPAVAPPTQQMPVAPYTGPFAGPDVIGERGQATFADPLAGLPAQYTGREGTQAEYGVNYGRGPAETGPYQTTEADYGANYGPGPAAVVGPYNMDIDPGGLSGQTGRAGYPSTEFDPGGLQGQTGRAGFPSTVTDPGGLQGQIGRGGYPSAATDPGGLQGQAGRAGYPSTVTDLGGLFGQTGRAGYPSTETDPGGLQGQQGRAGYPNAVETPAISALPAETQQDLSNVIEILETKGATPAQVYDVVHEMLRDAGAPQQVTQEIAKEAADISAFTGPGMTTFQGAPESKGAYPGWLTDIATATQGQPWGNPLVGNVAPEAITTAPGGWQAQVNQAYGPFDTSGPYAGPFAGPDVVGGREAPITGKGDLPATPFDARYGDWPTAPAEYAGPLAGPDVVGDRSAPAEVAGPPGRGIGADIVATKGVDPGLLPSLQAINTVSPNYKGVFDTITNNVPEAQRGDFGKTINNLSDNAKANVLSRGPEALVDMIARDTGRSKDQITSWINNQYATFGYPGYPGGMQGLGRDMAAARDASIAQGTPGRASTQFYDPSITPNVQYAGTPGWVDQTQVTVGPPTIAPPTQEMPTTPESLPPMEPLSSPMPHATGPGGITEIDETPPASPTTEAPPVTPTSPTEIPEATSPAFPSSAVAGMPSNISVGYSASEMLPYYIGDAQAAASADPQTAAAIIAANPGAVGNIASTYGVGMPAAAMLLALMAGMGAMGGMGGMAGGEGEGGGGLTLGECSTNFQAAKARGSKKSWKDFRKSECGPDVSTAAEGGRVYYVPQGSRGDDFGRWPKAPTPDYPGYVAGYGREIARRHYDAQQGARAIAEAVKINSRNWERFIRESPRSTNIEDRREHDETMGSGYQQGGSVPWGQDWGKEDNDGWR